MRQITLNEFLSQTQIAKAHRLYRKCKHGTFAKTCADEIIGPSIDKINQKLGTKNDPLFLAYVCEYVFNEAKGG